MKKYLSTWNLSRFLRLTVGIAIIVQGILVKDWMFIGLGGLFSIMPLMNIGCGVNGACNTPTSKNTKNEEFTYKEVK